MMKSNDDDDAEMTLMTVVVIIMMEITSFLGNCDGGCRVTLMTIINHKNDDEKDNTGFLGNGDGGCRDEEKSSSVKLSLS